MISYIVSSYDRPQHLEACLSCLDLQKHNSGVFVCVNATEQEMFMALSGIAFSFLAHVLPTGKRGAKTCYESANMSWEGTGGDWLCFPSDDSLYVSGFSEIMLRTAELAGADVVYCDCVYKVGTTNNKAWKDYSVLSAEPRMGKIDKTNFIVRRSVFRGFPEHPRDWRDGALIEQLKASGAKFAKAPGILVVHQ